MRTLTPRGANGKRPHLASRSRLQGLTILKILEKGGATLLRFKSKAALFNQGDPVGSVYFIIQGQVQITVRSRQGKEGAIAIFSKGDFVGEASLTRQPLYLDSALTLTDCEVLKMQSYDLRAMLDSNAALTEYFTNFLLKRTIDVQADLVDHLFNSSEKRLARVLLLLANFGHAGKLEPIANITHELLAQRVGTTRARITFFMNKFRRLGLIDYDGEIKVNSGLLNIVLGDASGVMDAYAPLPGAKTL